MPRPAGQDVEERPQPQEEPVPNPESSTIPLQETELSDIPLPPQGVPHVEEEEPEFQIPLGMHILYVLLSPLMVPTIVSLFIFLLSILAIVIPDAVVPYTLTVFGATCVVPLVGLFLLQKVGIVKTFRMYSRKERVFPYVIEFLALGAMALFFALRGANAWIWTIYCGGAAIALVNFLINFKLRISSHCSAMAALLASLIVINKYGFPQASLFWWVVGTVFFAGLIGTLAMLEGRHTFREVLAGYATGFLGIILFSLIH